MPISTDTNTVIMHLQSGGEYVIQATGGTITIEVDRNGADYTEGVVADGERKRLNIPYDQKKVPVKFTPSGAGVDWSVSPVVIQDN